MKTKGVYEQHNYPIEANENKTKNTPYDLLQRAIFGDLTAAASVLGYLTAGLHDLRQIMQDAIHTYPDPHLWRCLLTYYAVGEWGEWDPFSDTESPRARRMNWKDPVTGSAAQAITKLFITDSDDAEGKRKQLVLKRALHGMEPVRFASACILGLRGDLDAIPILEDMVCGGGDPEKAANETWQIRAITALGSIRDSHCGPALLCALTSRHKSIHRAAAVALRDMGPAAENILLLALQHPDSHIRWHAAHALGMIGDLRGIDSLVGGLRDEHPAVRWAAAATLANIDCPAVPYILRLMIAHPMDEPFRQSVYHALHAMTSQSARSYLHELLEVLCSQTAFYQAPVMAQRMLADWKSVRCE